jgi:hypothetical protein
MKGRGAWGKDRHGGYRHDRAHGGADDLAETAGQHHAAQWLTDDDHGHDRPLGLVEVEQEGQVKRQQPGRNGSQGKQQHPGTGVENRLEVLQQCLHGGARWRLSSKRSHSFRVSTARRRNMEVKPSIPLPSAGIQMSQGLTQRSA